MIRVVNAFVWHACSVLLISWLSILIIGRIYDFHNAYIAFIEQVKSEAWLLQQCQDDHFYHNMAYHTDVCATVKENSNISPILYSLNHSARTLKLCGLYDCTEFAAILWTGGIPVVLCLVMLYICTPSFLLPAMRSEFDRRREASIVRRSSPNINRHPLDPSRVKTV